MMNTMKKLGTIVFVFSLLMMLWTYATGYDNSLSWEVVTTGEVIEFPAWSTDNGFLTHEISGERYLLSETYAGGAIERNYLADYLFLGIIWLGLCLALVASTYLRKFAFFGTMILFVLFINRLNLFEVGLFGWTGQMVVLIPFLLFIIPLFLFHEFFTKSRFIVRLGVLLVLSGILLAGIDSTITFTDHFIAHSLFGFSICGLIFLFIISEEIIFGILYMSSSVKGGKNNHVHFLILSLVYLGNLTMYYLNKSGVFENSLFFFDPFILLAITSIVSLWSLRFKASHLSDYFPESTFDLLVFGLGITSTAFLAHQMFRGNDAVYEAFHYFILYFHLGFGAFFFLYIIGNFIDPLIKGLEVYKIAYRERNLPYFTIRFGGFVAVLAFYFLSAQESFNLLKSGHYDYLGEKARAVQDTYLAGEYYEQAGFLGYNTHMAHYNLGWIENQKGDRYSAKTLFLKAAQRYPSPYALVNYGNIEVDTNPNKVQAVYQEYLRTSSNGEVTNNLGALMLEKGNFDQALVHFKDASPSDNWNQAPLINKWHVYNKMGMVDSTELADDFKEGNYGTKSNILATQSTVGDMEFEYSGLGGARSLHRQAYLINSTYLFDHDSVEAIVREELEQSTDGDYVERLGKALAIHLYRKGDINEAFMMMDFLQANAPEYDRGVYLNALGKFAMDQGAFQLAIDFFDLALEAKHSVSLLGKVEAMIHAGQKADVPEELLVQLKQYPELTDQVNLILELAETYPPVQISYPQVPSLEGMTDEAVASLGRKNAFHIAQVVEVVDTLAARGATGGYELLVEATEINPYSDTLLKKYILAALDWNLVDYADQSMEKLKTLVSESDFNNFLLLYEERKAQAEAASW